MTQGQNREGVQASATAEGRCTEHAAASPAEASAVPDEPEAPCSSAEFSSPPAPPAPRLQGWGADAAPGHPKDMCSKGSSLGACSAVDDSGDQIGPAFQESVIDACQLAEVLANFKALLHDVDFSRDLQLLGIRRFEFMRRLRMLDELRAVYVGLWFLALQRSFPMAAQQIFDLFFQQHASKRTSKRDMSFRMRAQQYKEMLMLSGDKDFTAVSRHLLSFAPSEEELFKANTLRLALSLRARYTFIFERLL